MGVETIFLDAGGVLVFPNWERVATILGEHGIETSPSALSAADPHAKFQLDRDVPVSTVTDGWHLYFQTVFDHAGIRRDSSLDAVTRAMREYHNAHNLWDIVPDDVRQVLLRLRQLGLRLVVVSNANGTVADQFKRLGLSDDVDLIVDSALEGVEKPNPRLFHIALERAGATVDTTIHIGDLFQVDVEGARAAGIPAVLLDPANLYREYDCPRVGSLTEFADRLENGHDHGLGMRT